MTATQRDARDQADKQHEITTMLIKAHGISLTGNISAAKVADAINETIGADYVTAEEVQEALDGWKHEPEPEPTARFKVSLDMTPDGQNYTGQVTVNGSHLMKFFEVMNTKTGDLFEVKADSHEMAAKAVSGEAAIEKEDGYVFTGFWCISPNFSNSRLYPEPF